MPTPTLSTTWTCSGPGGTFSAANAGVTNITRSRTHLAADTCTLQFDGRVCDAAPPFAFGATVTVARDGVVWFTGRVTSNPASGNDRSEAQACVLTGPWWYLAQLVYQQQWSVQGGAATAWSSRLVLGQALDGSRLTTGQVVTAALQYAIDAGAPLAIGVVEPAFDAPLDEVKDFTCAEVIKAMLRWHPDCVAWFDYTTAPQPTFHCRARASLSATSLAIGAPPLAAVQGLTARHDLQVPAVVLHFETTSRANGQVQTDLVTDAAPAGATGREFGAVVGTIPLRGADAVVLSQKIVTQPVVSDIRQPDLITQLASRSPVLAMYAADPAITAAGITVTQLTRSAGAGYGTGVLLHPNLGNSLVEGQITDWMLADYGLHAETQTLTFSYTLDRGSGDASSDPQEASITFKATDAVTGLYTTLSSYRPATPRRPGWRRRTSRRCRRCSTVGRWCSSSRRRAGVGGGAGAGDQPDGRRGVGLGGDARGGRGGNGERRGRHDDVDARAVRGIGRGGVVGGVANNARERERSGRGESGGAGHGVEQCADDRRAGVREGGKVVMPASFLSS